MVEPLTTAIISTVLTSGTYDLIKYGVKEIKDLFKKQGHEITETQAEKIVNQIQTGDLIQQVIHGDNITGDKISIGTGDYVAGDKFGGDKLNGDKLGGDKFDGNKIVNNYGTTATKK